MVAANWPVIHLRDSKRGERSPTSIPGHTAVQQNSRNDQEGVDSPDPYVERDTRQREPDTDHGLRGPTGQVHTVIVVYHNSESSYPIY